MDSHQLHAVDIDLFETLVDCPACGTVGSIRPSQPVVWRNDHRGNPIAADGTAHIPEHLGRILPWQPTETSALAAIQRDHDTQQ